MHAIAQLSSRARRAALALLALAAVAALAGLGLFGPGSAAPASAHDTLLRSSPADGEQLASAPSEWTLEFSAEILPVGAEAVLVDEQGQVTPLGPPTIQGQKVSFALGSLAQGSWTGQWRVVSSDGHPIAGTIVFGVGVPAGQVVTAAPAGGGPQATPGGDGSATSNPVESAGVPPWLVPLLGLIAVAAAVAGAFAIMAKSRRTEALPPAASDEDAESTSE
ncbi:hypothetical protein USB125703_01200 [Pseudoclavibacter triregionum]|nr:hypothetical protein USB125703_01200 [Pseudoclavibacter triregionum]